mgnify:FL=1
MKILLIEDDPHTSGYVAKGLREHGHVVDQSANGREGLLLASGGNYDVMVIDRMLPGLDGLAIVKTIRAAGTKAPALRWCALPIPVRAYPRQSAIKYSAASTGLRRAAPRRAAGLASPW